MKYFTRLELYKASNVTFNPETIEAYSYGWWRFVQEINGTVIFNQTYYSNMTVKHQHKVWSVMQSLGIEFLGIRFMKESLDGTDSFKEIIKGYNQRIDELRAEIAKPRTQKKKNLEREEEIYKCCDMIRTINRIWSNKV